MEEGTQDNFAINYQLCEEEAEGKGQEAEGKSRGRRGMENRRF